MLLAEYLVPSRARRDLLGFLIGSDRGFSVRQLSRAIGLPYSVAHREVRLLEEVGLVGRAGDGSRRWNRRSPAALSIRRIFGRGDDEERVLASLAAHGAPLVRGRAATGPGLSLEETLGRALTVARRRADVARVWPVVFCRNRSKIDLRALEFVSKRLGQRRTLGFFVALSRRLSKDGTLALCEERLRDRRVRAFQRFFVLPRGRRALDLEKRRTPALARTWFFWMNASDESFESCFLKFVKTDGKVRGR